MTNSIQHRIDNRQKENKEMREENKKSWLGQYIDPPDSDTPTFCECGDEWQVIKIADLKLKNIPYRRVRCGIGICEPLDFDK